MVTFSYTAAMACSYSWRLAASIFLFDVIFRIWLNHRRLLWQMSQHKNARRSLKHSDVDCCFLGPCHPKASCDTHDACVMRASVDRFPPIPLSVFVFEVLDASGSVKLVHDVPRVPWRASAHLAERSCVTDISTTHGTPSRLFTQTVGKQERSTLRDLPKSMNSRSLQEEAEHLPQQAPLAGRVWVASRPGTVWHASSDRLW